MAWADFATPTVSPALQTDIMGKLQAALDWAARGFRVFPLQVNSKDPLDISWTVHATADPVAIRQWWTDPVLGTERDYNIGFLTTDWIVPDIDTKRGKKGLETMCALGLEWDTLTMRTPSGGYHQVYRGLEGRIVGQSPLGPGVDLRSHNGYVVAPGSTLDGVEYRVEIDLPPAPFPEDLRAKLKSPKQRAAAASVSFDYDTPEVVELVAHWLLYDAPVAVEGENGDDTTYRVACRARDMGVSESVAYDLLLDEYNPRCAPPWAPETLRGKVENAYRYATGVIGALSPVAAFQDVEILPLPKVNGHSSPHVNGGPYKFGNMLDAELIEMRPWVFGNILLDRVVTLLVGAGGAGKSVLMLTIAAHLAVGKDFMGMKVYKPGKSIIYNAEDDLTEASRRLNAICDAYGLDKMTVRDSIALVTSDDIVLQVTTGTPPVIDSEKVQALVAAASDPDVRLVGVDPLVETHTGNENDTMQMKYVMAVFRMVARMAAVSVMVASHTGKPPLAASGSWAGNQNAGRGSSAQGASARVVLTLFGAAESDCEDIGVLPHERGGYVRLDGAKANFAAAEKQPRWLKWQERLLPQGDKVGVLVAHNVVDAYGELVRETATILAQHLIQRGTATMTVEEGANVLRQNNALLAKEDAVTVRKRVSRLLASPVAVASGAVVKLVIDAGRTRIALD